MKIAAVEYIKLFFWNFIFKIHTYFSMETYQKGAHQKFLKITQIKALFLSYICLVLRKAEVHALASFVQLGVTEILSLRLKYGHSQVTSVELKSD